MKYSFTHFAFSLALVLPTLGIGQTLTVGVFGGTSRTEPILSWNDGIIKQDKLEGADSNWVAHYGVMAKAQIFEKLFFRGEIFYRSKQTAFNARYKVVNDEWQALAKHDQSTINLMLAPQIHFFPKGLGYVFAGLGLEINRNKDFDEGSILIKHEDTGTTTLDISESQNTTSPSVIAGLGINPRFKKFGFFAEVRYSRSRPTAIHTSLPRVGQEFVTVGAGLTYDIIE